MRTHYDNSCKTRHKNTEWHNIMHMVFYNYALLLNTLYTAQRRRETTPSTHPCAEPHRYICRRKTSKHTITQNTIITHNNNQTNTHTRPNKKQTNTHILHSLNHLNTTNKKHDNKQKPPHTTTKHNHTTHQSDNTNDKQNSPRNYMTNIITTQSIN